MKVAIIGNGNVGMSVFHELRMQHSVNEIILIGIEVEKVKGEVDDYLDALALNTTPVAKMSYGDYSATKDVDIIIYTAGIGRKPGQSRLDLAKINVKIAKDVFTEINKYNKDAIIIVISNPADIITYVAAKVSGRPKEKIIGTGTLLDTGRLKRLISEMVEVSPTSIHGYVIGEHGSSAVIVESSLKICNMPFEDFLDMKIGNNVKVDKQAFDEAIKGAGARIIGKKGSTSYGVAVAARRVVSAIIGDSKEILPVSTTCLDKYGKKDIAISVPCVIGKGGVLTTIPLKLTEEESIAFDKSCDIVKATIDDTVDF